MRYPANYGFVPHTLSPDGDPLDALVVARSPFIPGCVVRARPIAVLNLEDEHGGEEGFFSALDKVSKPLITARLKEIKVDKGAREEAAVLKDWLTLSNQETDLKHALKHAESELDAKAYARYPKLSEGEIKTLVVDDKWLAALDTVIHGEMDRISQALTQRVKELAERYETPMPQMVNRAAELEARVNKHLERMGFAWN